MKKCPFLSTALECYAGSSGTVHCMKEQFHKDCGFRKTAEKKKEKEIVFAS